MSLRRFVSRLGFRLFAFNLLLVFLPAAGILYLDTYESHMLAAQERTMVQQGRLLAAALSGPEALDAAAAEHILVQLNRRLEARLRVVDADGRVVADSSALGPRREPGAEEGADDPGAEPAQTVREDPLYRLGSAVHRLYRALRPSGGAASDAPGLYLADPSGRLTGPAVEEALAGRYGADLRSSPGGARSLTLHSAIPVTGGGRVTGAVLVSQSTSRILAALYAVRLGIFEVFLASVAAAAVLSLLVSTTIARPLKRLRNEAAALADRRGRLQGRFRRSGRQDEIGDLSRALEELTRRLADHQGFTESFASDVSHEFKNPLASIRTATEMLAEAETVEERQRFSGIALEEVARLEGLLGAVGEISRLDADVEEEDEPVALDALLAGVAEGCRLRRGGGPEVVLRLPGEPVTLTASPDRLAQVLENLLDNAIGFTPSEGRVEVELARRDGAAVITVSDTGPGIPEEHLERIFDRFFTWRPGGGDEGGHAGHHSGLGLAIAKAIVEHRGGRLTAANRPEGGARFEVRLPLGG
jgi:two-component system sensor histidine kinase ChvG